MDPLPQMAYLGQPFTFIRKFKFKPTHSAFQNEGRRSACPRHVCDDGGFASKEEEGEGQGGGRGRNHIYMTLSSSTSHILLQSSPQSGVQLILCPPLESPPEFAAKFTLDAAGCLLHQSSGLFVHPKTGKGKEGKSGLKERGPQHHIVPLLILLPPGVPLMLQSDPPTHAGEIEFAFLPVSASSASAAVGGESCVAVSASVPASPVLIEWSAPVHESLAGDDNIEGDSYEVGRV